jgi:DNA-binding response OmpR family regulator
MDKLKGPLLIVEDVPDTLRLIEAALTFKGYRVITAHNGLEALEAIGKERPALVITDILMPKMDGFSLVHRMRINPEMHEIPVIFLSATYVEAEDKAFATAIGVTSFLEKPIDIERFLSKIEEILRVGAQKTRPLLEREFYEGYQKRLEHKLTNKIAQIAREERLLETLSEEEKPPIKASLYHAKAERDEIQALLDQVRKRLEQL